MVTLLVLSRSVSNGRKLTVLLLESVYASLSVEELLLTREEWVALRAHTNTNLRNGCAANKGVSTAAAINGGIVIRWVNVLFHSGARVLYRHLSVNIWGVLAEVNNSHPAYFSHSSRQKRLNKPLGRHHPPASVHIHKNRLDPGLYGHFSPFIQYLLPDYEGFPVNLEVLTGNGHRSPLNLPLILGGHGCNDGRLAPGQKNIIRKPDVSHIGDPGLLEEVKTLAMMDVFIDRGYPLVVELYLN